MSETAPTATGGTATAGPGTTRTAGGSRQGTPIRPDDRGTLEIDRSVLRKITEYAADHTPGSVRVRRRAPAGVGHGDEGATARLTGPDRELRIRLNVPLAYPAPIQDTVRTLRERVIRALEELADCRVRTIDVTVWTLVPSGKPPRVE